MKIILVHGIHSSEAQNNMSVLWPWLQRHLPEHEIVLHSYGFMGFWKARWDNDRQARRLAGVVDGDGTRFVEDTAIRDGDVVITHSNGAAITWLACDKYGARPAGVININPALDRWRTAPVDWVETIHSEGDRWVWLSQWLPGHVWGDQGRVGYRGDADNTLNHNASEFGSGMAYAGHCDLFDIRRVDRWAAFLAQRITERLEAAAWFESQAALSGARFAAPREWGQA